MRKYKIAVTQSDEYPVRTDCLTDIFKNHATVDEVEMPFRTLDKGEKELYAKKLLPYDALLVRSGIFDEDLLNKLNNLRVICIHGAGYDQIDIDSANKNGVYVLNVPGGNANGVIELTIGLIINSTRRLYDSILHLKHNKNWNVAKITGSELCGKKLGIIGFGKIGQGVAHRALSFGMDIKAYDPYISKESFGETEDNLNICDNMDEIFTDSDVVTLHLPLTSETKNLINSQKLDLMKNNCILINTSRGPLINEDDLYEALSSKKIGGAALDVFSTEPIDNQSKFFNLDNVILTPHIGGSTKEALERIAKVAGENILTFLKTEQANNLVNLPEAKC